MSRIGRIRCIAIVATLSSALALAVGSLRSGSHDSAEWSVRDKAGLMNSTEQAVVAEYHEHLLTAFDIDYRVMTLGDAGDIDRSAVQLFRDIGRVSRSTSGCALLLLIDLAANRVRLEVGYPLEGTLPDSFVNYVERQQMVPFLEDDRVADSIVATTELIVARVQSGDRICTAETAETATSGGAGATVDARLGAGATAKDRDGREPVQPGTSPEQTLRAYVRTMAEHNSDPSLAIYTAQTREMLAEWLMTPAQMDNSMRTYRRCQPGSSIIADNGKLAVIRYPISARQCVPFFFQRQGDRWLLDLATMQRAIGFGRANAWHFVPGSVHPYSYAFADWRIDAVGYPVP